MIDLQPTLQPPRLPPSTREIRFVFSGLMMAMVLASLDQNIVNTALPRIATDLGGLSHLSWVVTAFLMASTTATPLYGKLSDMYGRKRLFTISISIFLAASMLCGLAGSMLQLILYRTLQGLGAGGLMTLSQTVIGDLVEPRERPRYQGYITGAFAIASVTGPLIGGVITTELSWRWIFYVNVPVGLAALTLIRIGLRRRYIRSRHEIDFVGAGLLTAATVATLLTLSWGGAVYPWLSPTIGAIAAAAIVLFGLFFWHERRAREPIIGIHLFHNRTYAFAVVTSGLMMLAMLGSTVFLPLYFQLVLGMSPTRAGLMMLPQVGGMVLSSFVGGRFVSWTGRYKPFLMAGIGLEAAALTALAILAIDGAGWLPFEIAMGALGTGMGTGMPNITTAVQNAVSRADLGVATSSMTFVRSLGGVVGVAMSGGVMGTRLRAILSEQPVPIDVSTLLDHGLSAMTQLSLDQQQSVRAAYGHAISTSFIISAVLMSVAFALVINMPAQLLRGRSPNQEAVSTHLGDDPV